MDTIEKFKSSLVICLLTPLDLNSRDACDVDHVPDSDYVSACKVCTVCPSFKPHKHHHRQSRLLSVRSSTYFEQL